MYTRQTCPVQLSGVGEPLWKISSDFLLLLEGQEVRRNVLKVTQTAIIILIISCQGRFSLFPSRRDIKVQVVHV